MSPLAHRPRPSTVYWELTRSCAQACLHCRVDAGQPLPGELDTTAALRVADELVALGVHEVTLSGGQPHRHPGWAAIARRLADGGVAVRMFVAGAWLDAAHLAQATAAGVGAFTLSLDGPAAVHDRLRPPRTPEGTGDFAATLAALDRLRAAGLPARVVTVASRATIPVLDQTYELVRDHGVARWQVQLLQAGGRAREHLDTLLPAPHQLEDILRVLTRALREGRVFAPMHCSIGYLVPEEVVLRNPRAEKAVVWRGSRAGLAGFALTARGEVLGCPCLPDSFATARVTERPLAAIWADAASFPYSRKWSPEVLGGACGRCGLAKACRAGCLSVAYGATGSIGTNPFCLRLVRGQVR